MGVQHLAEEGDLSEDTDVVVEIPLRRPRASAGTDVICPFVMKVAST